MIMDIFIEVESWEPRLVEKSRLNFSACFYTRHIQNCLPIENRLVCFYTGVCSGTYGPIIKNTGTHTSNRKQSITKASSSGAKRKGSRGNHDAYSNNRWWWLLCSERRRKFVTDFCSTDDGVRRLSYYSSMIIDWDVKDYALWENILCETFTAIWPRFSDVRPTKLSWDGQKTTLPLSVVEE